MNARLFLAMVSLVLFAHMLVGCTTTGQTVYTPVAPTIAVVPRPRAIDCPTVSVSKAAEDDYRMNGQSHTNLIHCLSDTVRYQRQSNTVMDYYETSVQSK